MNKGTITGRFSLRIEEGRRVFSVQCKNCHEFIDLPNQGFGSVDDERWMDMSCGKCGKTPREVHAERNPVASV